MLAATVALAARTLVFAEPRKTELVIIVHVLRPETNLSVNQIARIFRGDLRHWPNRQRIVIVLPPEHSRKVLDEFLKTIVNLDPATYDRYWEQKRFTGDVTYVPERSVDDAATIRRVAESTNSVAVVERSRIDAAEQRTIKILNVNGKRPQDPGYPLMVQQ